MVEPVPITNTPDGIAALEPVKPPIPVNAVRTVPFTATVLLLVFVIRILVMSSVPLTVSILSAVLLLISFPLTTTVKPIGIVTLLFKFKSVASVIFRGAPSKTALLPLMMKPPPLCCVSVAVPRMPFLKVLLPAPTNVTFENISKIPLILVKLPLPGVPLFKVTLNMGTTLAATLGKYVRPEVPNVVLLLYS